MGNSSLAKDEKVSTVDRNIDQLRKQLSILKDYLRTEPSAEILADFDAKTEEFIHEIMGSSSPMNDAYAYATVGEATGLMNMSEEGWREVLTSLSERPFGNVNGFLKIVWPIWKLAEPLKVNDHAGVKLPVHKSLITCQRPSEPFPWIPPSKKSAVFFKNGKLVPYWSKVVRNILAVLRKPNYLEKSWAARSIPPRQRSKPVCANRLVTIDTSDSMVDAVRLMKDKATRHLAVTEHDRIVGVVSVSDILRYYSGV